MTFVVSLMQLLAFAALVDPTACQGQPEPLPPPFNATVIRAFREKLLLNPPPVPDRSPYTPPQPPPPPPGWEAAVCGVLYDDEETRTRYRLENYTNADAARAAGAHVTHETPCGLCSSLEDLAVRQSTALAATRLSCFAIMSRPNDSVSAVRGPGLHVPVGYDGTGANVCRARRD